jgi:hypothetical protein
MTLSIEFNMNVPLRLDDGELSDLIVTFVGEVLDHGDETGAPEVVGRIEGSRVHVGLALERGEPLFDVCDAHSQTMMELYEALYNPETGEMREGIAEETSGTDILFVESIELLPEYRGRTLGLMALRRTLEFLGGGCAVAVVWAYPNRYDEVEDRDWASRMRPELFGVAGEEAAAKLRAHFERLGFTRIEGTDFLTFDLAYRLDDVPEPPPDA